MKSTQTSVKSYLVTSKAKNGSLGKLKRAMMNRLYRARQVDGELWFPTSDIGITWKSTENQTTFRASKLWPTQSQRRQTFSLLGLKKRLVTKSYLLRAGKIISNICPVFKMTNGILFSQKCTEMSKYAIIQDCNQKILQKYTPAHELLAVQSYLFLYATFPFLNKDTHK